MKDIFGNVISIGDKVVVPTKSFQSGGNRNVVLVSGVVLRICTKMIIVEYKEFVNYGKLYINDKLVDVINLPPELRCRIYNVRVYPQNCLVIK